MALLTILEFPDPRLRTKAVPVAEVTDETRKLIDDMFATMYNANGIGLLLPQVPGKMVGTVTHFFGQV